MVYSNNPNITFNCIFALGVIRVNEKRQRLFLEIQFDIKEPVNGIIYTFWYTDNFGNNDTDAQQRF